MTQSELVIKCQQEIKGLSSELVDDDYDNAYSEAADELSFGCPTDDTFRIKWLKKRLKRHIVSYLYDAALVNFDVPKAKLQQIVNNYRDRLAEMDSEYELAKSEYPVEFGILTAETEGDAFGQTVSTGFVQDSRTGEDLTYEVEDSVLINNRGE